MDKVKNVVLIKGYGNPHPDRWQNHEKRYAQSTARCTTSKFPI
jgi:hypothetical protein